VTAPITTPANAVCGTSVKPATTVTGLVVQVPLFINRGERIKVDTRTGEYLGRG